MGPKPFPFIIKLKELWWYYRNLLRSGDPTRSYSTLKDQVAFVFRTLSLSNNAYTSHGRSWNRTNDQLIKSQLLYRLSYASMRFRISINE
jgi:hypothetical protein